MTNKLILLLRVQYHNTSWLNQVRNEKDEKKKQRSIMMGIVMCFVFVVMTGYCFALSYGLGALGLGRIIPGYALAITSILTFIFTLLKTNGHLFAFKDYDMVMSLPFTTRTVIAGKFLFMYGTNVLFTCLVFLAMGAGYAIWSRPPFTVYVMWAAGALIAPLFPMTMAAALGAVIAKIGAGFRHKVLVQVLLTVILVFGLFGLTFWLQKGAQEGNIEFQIAEIGNMISNQIHSFYPLSIWFDHAIVDNMVFPFLLLCVFSIVWYGAFLFIVGKGYRTINTALSTYHAGADYHVKDLKKSSVLSALIRKEKRRFFSSVLYITNAGMGLIMALGVSLAIMLIGVDKLLGLFKLQETPDGFLYLAPFAIAMLVTMTCTTSVSLSLEGKQLWIVDSLPIGRQMVYKSKMAFNMLLVLPVSLICTVAIIIALKVPFLLAILYLLVGIGSVCLSTVWGMWINILFPNFEWENEVEVIKQGIASMIGMLGGMVLYVGVAAGTFFLSGVVSGAVVLAVVIALQFIAAGILYSKVSRN